MKWLLVIGVWFLTGVLTSLAPVKVWAGDVASNIPVTKRVMVLDFNPIIESRGGVRIRQMRNWNDPKLQEQQYVDELRKASGGYLNYVIVSRIDNIDDVFFKSDGFKYTDQGYLDVIEGRTSPHNPDIIDYPRLLRDYGICDKVNKGEIDELWMWGGPWMGFLEAVMAGKGAIYTNGSVIMDSSCQRGLHIMGFSYEVGVDAMLEDFMHRTEGVMKTVYADDSGGMSNWGKFSTYDKIKSGKAGCGWTHYPPNGDGGYDWGNPKTVVNNCDDWANYPNMTGVKKTFGCERWGCNGLGFKRWWLSNLPRAEGLGVDNYLANWWKYTVDWEIARTTIPLSPYLHRDGRSWCTNHGGIAMTVDHDVYGWLDCLAWCDQNMSAKLPLCQSNADGLRSCWINYPPGGKNGRVENCQWSNSIPPFGGWFIDLEGTLAPTITPTLVPPTPKPELPTPIPSPIPAKCVDVGALCSTAYGQEKPADCCEGLYCGNESDYGDSVCVKFSLVDLQAWKKEYLGGGGLTADFDKSGVVDMADLKVWKTGYLQ